MFRPVGSQPPSVYWRRRLALVASVIALLVLVVLTAKVVLSDDPSTPAAAGAGAGTKTSTTPPPSTPPSSSSRPRSSSSSPGTGSSASSKGGSSARTSSAAPKPCSTKSLHLSTATDKQTYPMNAMPQLSLLVKNTGSLACVQDLGDPQIVMRVYNGESRVWGSHDCKVNQSPNMRTLAAGSTVQLTIPWSGLSSRPNDCRTRQRVGAGTYTLYASLSGAEATAQQFTISPT